MRRFRFKKFKYLQFFKSAFFETFYYRVSFFTLLQNLIQKIWLPRGIFVLESDNLQMFKNILKVGSSSLRRESFLTFKNPFCPFFFPVLKFYLKGLAVLNILKFDVKNAESLASFDLMFCPDYKRFDLTFGSVGFLSQSKIVGFMSLLSFWKSWFLDFNQLMNLNNFFNLLYFIVFKYYRDLCQLISN